MHIRWTGAAAGFAVACALGFTGLAQAASLTGIYGPGASGPDVRELQSILDHHGYHMAITGYFGPVTEAAVKNFQATHHLATDGIVGPLTERVLDSTSRTTSTSASPRFEAARVSTYRVHAGDTLAKIAARFHTTWQHLVAINHLANPNNIRVGQVLHLTGTVTQSSRATSAVRKAAHSYRVQPGDTLSKIAARFHTSWRILARLNHLANPNALHAGQVLALPGGTSSTTMAANKSKSGSGSASVSLPVQRAPRSMDAAIVSTALKYLGAPYVWGGESPRGFDCSGLVQYVLGQNGISIGRTTWAQWNDVNHIARANLVPGDLVFFNTYASGASHVGIYIGSYPKLGYAQAFIDAPAPGQSVMVQNLNNVYWARHYYGAGAVRP